MAEAENPRAVPGSNNPPETDPLIVEANERIDIANRYLIERGDIDKWDKELADKVNAFTEQVTTTRKVLDDQRLQEGRDFDAKQRTKYAGPLTLLLNAKNALVALRRTYLLKEEAKLEAERKAKEEAARKATEEAEAIARHAEEEAKKKGGDPLRAELQAQQAKEKAQELQEQAAAAPVKAQISGHFSSRAKGLSDYWSAVVEDLGEAVKYYRAKKNPNKPIIDAAILEAVQQIANAEAKMHKDETKAAPGIRYIKERR